MMREAEKLVAEDEADRKCIEVLNDLSTFVHDLKSQLGDQWDMGDKLKDDEKRIVVRHHVTDARVHQ